MALTIAQQVRLVQNQLAVNAYTLGTKPVKLDTVGQPVTTQYCGVSASVTFVFTTSGVSPVLGGAWLSRSPGFWTMSYIPEMFKPTHFRFDTAVDGWHTNISTGTYARMTAWWAKEQEVNHVAIAAQSERADVGFWSGDVENVSIGGTVTDGGTTASSSASLTKIGEVPFDPAPSSENPIIIKIPPSIDLGRWGSLVVTPWFDFSGWDAASVATGTASNFYYQWLGGGGTTGMVSVKVHDTSSPFAVIPTPINLTSSSQTGWSPTVSLRGYYVE